MKFWKVREAAVLSFLMCLACVTGMAMWRTPKLFRFFWKDCDDPEELDSRLRKLGRTLMALGMLYLIYLVVRLLAA